MSDFSITASDITHGLPDDVFSHLSKKDRQRLIKVMARLAERSYRRGFQHGAVDRHDNPSIDPDGAALTNWRYGRTTDISPWFDRPGFAEKAHSRLFMENRSLERLGFRRGEE